MRKVKEILGGIWKLHVIVCFIVFLLLFYPFYSNYLRKGKERKFKKAFRLLYFHTKILLILSGIRVKLYNGHNIDKNQTYVIAPNHTSFLDIVILYQTFKNYFVFMGKEELAKVPIFNIFFKNMNITVNRKSRISGKRAMDRCEEELKKGNSVVVFPEGTIPKNTPQLGNFKSGAFKLAVENQIPIIPITFLDNYKRLEMKGLFSGKAGPGIARAIIHEPIPTAGLTEKDLISLQDKVYAIINKELEKHGRR